MHAYILRLLMSFCSDRLADDVAMAMALRHINQAPQAGLGVMDRVGIAFITHRENVAGVF